MNQTSAQFGRRGSTNPRSKFTQAQAQAVLDAPTNDQASELAASFGMSKGYAQEIRRKRAWGHLKRSADADTIHRQQFGRQGSAHPRAKFSEAQAQAILDASTAEEAIALGATFGMTRQYVFKVRRRELWKHLKKMDTPDKEAV